MLYHLLIEAESRVESLEKVVAELMTDAEEKFDWITNIAIMCLQ